jgi:hypothetical protein
LLIVILLLALAPCGSGLPMSHFSLGDGGSMFPLRNHFNTVQAHKGIINNMYNVLARLQVLTAASVKITSARLNGATSHQTVISM